MQSTYLNISVHRETKHLVNLANNVTYILKTLIIAVHLDTIHEMKFNGFKSRCRNKPRQIQYSSKRNNFIYTAGTQTPA